jgi:outer membrane protein OmpA-like peptidoglycan-associated protein
VSSRQLGNARSNGATLHPVVQARLKIGAPNDEFEREADRVADTVMRSESVTAAAPSAAPVAVRKKCAACASGQGLCEECAEEERLQSKEFPGVTPAAPPGLQSRIHGVRDGGSPLSKSERTFFEPRFGADFGGVRLHSGTESSALAEGLHAQAFTVGQDIFFGSGCDRAGNVANRWLLAHELTHVVQQAGSPGAVIRRRFLADGSAGDVESMILLLEPAMGAELEWDPATHEITAVASLGPPTSATLENTLTGIINDAGQDAVVSVGQNQPDVVVGAFPLSGTATPADFTGPQIQTIDIDDILNIEAGAPGAGVAALTHEIVENYEAHGIGPLPGGNVFDVAHQGASIAESDVAEDLIGPGRRVAEASFPTGANTVQRNIDFENYYLVLELTSNPATGNIEITSSRQAALSPVSQYVIDQFVSSSAAVPAGGAADIAAAAADLVAHPGATVLIEGFTDDVGELGNNDVLGEDRARETRDAIIAAAAGGGLPEDRFHLIGQGETRFVAANDTDAHRALNRRVDITISEPGP